MLKHALLRIALEVSGLTAVWMSLRQIGLHQDRGADDVVPCLRSVDPEQIEQLFDPLAEQAAGFWNYRVCNEMESVRARVDDAWILTRIVRHALKTDREEGNKLVRFLFKTAEEVRERRAAEYLPQPKIERLEKFWFISRNARRNQRARLDLAREYIRRMYHNAVIVQQWANTERFYLMQGLRAQRGEAGGIPPGADHELPTIDALRRTAKACRFTCMLALAKIWFLMLLRFDLTRLLPIPNVSALERTGRTGLWLAYQEMKDAAALLGASFGEEFSDQLRAAL